MARRPAEGEYNPNVAAFWAKFTTSGGQTAGHSASVALYSTMSGGHFFIVDESSPPTMDQLVRGTAFVHSTVDTIDSRKEFEQFIRGHCDALLGRWMEPKKSPAV